MAKDILRSFESIRIRLIVGIEGEALSNKYNIRLGNIIVDYPIYRASGIIHYNFSKTIRDREFE